MKTIEHSPPVLITRGLTFLLAFACGAVVANLYYAQTLITAISLDLQLNLKLSGLIVTLTQVGYGLGLLFIAPLSDLVENRRLLLLLLGLTFLSLLGIILSANSIVFLVFCFLLGLTAVAAQIILPFVAHLTSPEKRGAIVGQVMSGLLMGIMLSRPIASFLSYLFSWQAVFIFSAAFMLLLIFLFKRFFPQRKPEHNLSYTQLIASFPMIFKSYPILRRRAFYHALLFFIFSLFWTSIAMLLMGDFFHYTEEKVALFALVGATGAMTAPIAGRIADKGWTRQATGAAILLVCASCLISKWHQGYSITALVLSALILDIGVACNVVLGQRSIYALAPEIRGRLNGLYVSLFFMGGAVGSGLSGYLYKIGGWNAIANTGLIVSLLTLLYFLTEYRQSE